MAVKAKQQYYADETTIKKEAREFGMIDELKDKLDSIEYGAQVNIIEEVQENGVPLEIVDKSVNVLVPEVIDNLYTIDPNNSLSAKQGKILYDMIKNLLARGRFLSTWNTATGLPVTNPEESPYEYKAGDYYIVGIVAAEGGTNFRPEPGEYVINVASDEQETSEVHVSDIYVYDGEKWILLINSTRELAVDDYVDHTYQSTNPVENQAIAREIDTKQNKFYTVSTTSPSNPVEGDEWYDATNDKVFYWDGTQWKEMGGGEDYTAGLHISIDPNDNNKISVVEWSATSSALGLVKLGSDAVQSTSPNNVTSTTGRTYRIQANGSGQLMVNVPWTDTTYLAGTGISISNNRVISCTVKPVTVGPTAPSTPGTGDLWYDTNKNTMFLYKNNAWTIIGPEIYPITKADYDALTPAEQGDGRFFLITDNDGTIYVDWENVQNRPMYIGTTSPANPCEGYLWYDTTNDVLKIYNGTQWNEVGGGGTTYTAGNGISISNDEISIDTTVVATKTDLSSKQDTISDLATIRSGASAGATAIQPNDNVSELTNDAGYITSSALDDYSTTTEMNNAISTATSGLATESYVDTALSSKQDTLTAGANITIAQDGTISATDTTYTAGTGIDITNGVISNTQTSAEWGNITGTLSDQTDLQDALDDKQDTISDLATIRSNATAGKSASDTIATYGDVVTHNASEFATTAQGALADTAVQPGDNVSDLTNDAGYITNSALNGYATESYVDTGLAAKADKSELPTKTSDLTNDSGFITNAVNDLSNYYTKTQTYSKTEVDNLIASVGSFEVVATLPSVDTADTKKIYLLGPIGTGADKYEEYIVTESEGVKSWTKIGETSIDLSNYVTSTQLATTLQDYATTTQLATKQDTLTAGTNIQISNNIISATDTKYTAGTNISIDANNVISAADTTYTAGDGIDITNNEISVDTDVIQEKLTAGTGISITGGTVCTTESDRKGPAPSGFHVPSITEWQGVKTIMDGLSLTTGDNWRINLHMPFAGFRSFKSAKATFQGNNAYLWSSTSSTSTYYADYLYLDSSDVGSNTYDVRAYGFSIRCFKNSYEVPDSSWTVIQGTLGSAGIFWNQSEGLISITDGSTGYTIMDKNLGATTVYNDGDTLSEANCGKYYQWGNNYGFPFTGSITTSSTKVDASGYGPTNYYESDTFITVTAGNWSSVQNDNLWGNTSNSTHEECVGSPLTISADTTVVATQTDLSGKQDKATSGSAAPSTTPSYVGQQYIDTTADKMYVATGTTSSSDWTEVGAGSGDMLYSDFGWETLTGASVTLALRGEITPSANFTVNKPNDLKDGQFYVLRVDNGATAYTMTLGTGVTNPYSEDLTLVANNIQQFMFLAKGGNLELQPSTEGISYTAGNGIDITNNEISVDTDVIQEKLTAGTGISIGEGQICVEESDRKGPAPSGFHVPSTTEWQGVKTIMNGLSLTTGNNWKINLHMPFAGFRSSEDASVLAAGNYAFLLSSSPSSNNIHYVNYLRLSSSDADADRSDVRAYGYSVRSFKNTYEEPDSSWAVVQGTLGSAGIFWNQSKGLISITDGSTGYTMMDKNLGATTVYNDGDTLTQANMGNMYQWGNNYGFPSTGTISNTSSTQVDASGYGPTNPYSSDTYIIGNTDWSSVQNDDLWGNTSNSTHQECTGGGPLTISSTVNGFNPSNAGTEGQVLTKTSTGYNWANAQGGGGNVIAMTQAEYNALTIEEKNDGKLRIITDAPTEDISVDWANIANKPIELSTQSGNTLTSLKIWVGSQTDYEALATKDASTLYFTTNVVS